MRAMTLAMLVVVTACRAGDTATPTSSPDVVTDEPEPDGEPATEPRTRRSGSKEAKAKGALECEPLGDAAVADEAHARGVATLKEASDGEHYRVEPFAEGMEQLRRAAELGHRGAQSLFGRRSFESMFLVEAPRPEEREAYVVALSFIRIAGRRGDPDAADYLPGLLEQPDLSQPPFDQIPAGWVREAIARADAWLSCYAEPAGDRGTTRRHAD